MEIALEGPAGRTQSGGGRPGAATALALCMLGASLGTSIANVALPPLAKAFGAGFAQVQWVVLSYLFASTAALVVVGRLGDLLGRKRLLVAGILIFTAGAALAGAAPTLELLVAARAVQGLGAATMTALALALIGESVPEGKAGRAMGLLGSTSAAGTALGPSLGGLLIAAGGWRPIFLVALPIGAAAFLLAVRSLPEAPRSGTPAPIAPFIPLDTLRDPAVRDSMAMSFLVSTVLMATLVVGPFHLSQAFGLGPAAVGMVLSVGPAIVIFAGVPAGRAADRFGASAVTAAGLAAILLGCLLLALLPRALGLFGYLTAIAVLTLGYALFQTANNVAAMAAAEARDRGAVSGLLNLSRSLGLIAGASGLGGLFARIAGVGAAPDEVAFATRVTFAAAALLAILALAVALRRRLWRGRQT